MSGAFPWHPLQVWAIFVVETGERESLTGRMPWAPWQLAHWATAVSPWASFFPWPLDLYSANWSMRRDGLYCFISAASAWHLPHRPGMSRGGMRPAESLLRVVRERLVLLRGVSSVAEDAGEPVLRVNVVAGGLRRRSEPGIVDGEVAFHAGWDGRQPSGPAGEAPPAPGLRAAQGAGGARTAS